MLTQFHLLEWETEEKLRGGGVPAKGVGTL